MIQEFVNRFMEAKPTLREYFRGNWPSNYGDIVEAVVKEIGGDRYATPSMDPGRITCIDHGHYQGTLLYVVATTGYQPSTYYATKVDYGSCSGCDALEGIYIETVYNDSGDDRKVVSEQNLDDIMTLALHIVQGFKEI
jgi:hypothetical protein